MYINYNNFLYKVRTLAVVGCKTFLESLIRPETGSLPKYFTCMSVPTSNPKADGCAT